MSSPVNGARGSSRGATRRTVGKALLGSAIALATLAALALGGVLALDDDTRWWVSAGAGVAAVADAMIAVYFLRASSQP